MLSRLKQRASFRGSVLPWSASVKAVFCSRLPFVWRALMILTVLCVALQLLSAVYQSRNNKTTLSDRPSSNPVLTEQRDDQATEKNSNHVDFYRFQWINGKNKEPKQVSEKSSKILHTTPARRLASTSGRTSKQLAGKADPTHDLKDVPKQSQTQDFAQNTIFLLTPSSGQKTNSRQTFGFLTSDRKDTCRPKNHVVFLKTHKTASSTILNILYRYGDTHNLTFALPVNMYSQLYYPHFFRSHFVEGAASRRVTEFHIMCNHMRFRGPEVKKVMPSDTFYFSILRNPVSMMESIFTYYKAIPAFHKFKTLNDFLLDEGRSYNATLPNNHYAQNILTYDFGFNNSAPSSDAELDARAVAVISAVESEFHVVLISEYFDESMVLLRHALCWTLEDVVSFRLNSRSEKSRKPLGEEMVERVKKWSSLDWRLYLHFNASFWRRIDTTLGREKLQEEVKLLRAKRAELEKTCLVGGGAVEPGQVHDSSLKPLQYGQAVILGYNIRPGLDNDTHRLCQRLIMPELQYTRALYIKQFPDLASKIVAAKKPTTGKRTMNATRYNTTVAVKRGVAVQRFTNRPDSVKKTTVKHGQNAETKLKTNNPQADLKK